MISELARLMAYFQSVGIDPATADITISFKSRKALAHWDACWVKEQQFIVEAPLMHQKFEVYGARFTVQLDKDAS